MRLSLCVERAVLGEGVISPIWKTVVQPGCLASGMYPIQTGRQTALVPTAVQAEQLPFRYEIQPTCLPAELGCIANFQPRTARAVRSGAAIMEA